ncbi:MAG: response regulator [Candidatus Lokiarchaeota archaeon]|nr:response regulator [Candidatus Lokiarchaeota archaeon]
MLNIKQSEPIDILLVEDNPADIRLIEEEFKEYNISINLHIVNDGELAMDYLKGKGKYKDREFPDLILLDLNLPRKDGRDVIADIRDDPVLKNIPVIILTTSATEDDIMITYNNKAICYIIKPFKIKDFIQVVDSIEFLKKKGIIKVLF